MNPGKRKAPCQPADDAPRDILDLLARCVTSADNGAWCELIEHTRSFVRRRCRIKAEEQREEFLKWFYSWLHEHNKLSNLYASLHRACAVKPAPATIEQIDKHFYTYFAKIVASAVSDFFVEIRGSKISNIEYDMPVAVPQTMPKSLEELPQQSKWKKPIEFVRMDNIADATERDIFLHQKRRVSELPKDETLFEEQRARLDAALVKLKSGLRIPFILTFVSNVLTDQDIAWIAEQAGRSPTETATMIEAESAVCHKSKYALSSQFIADLLGIQPDTVSQRVRRARLQLAALLGGAP